MLRPIAVLRWLMAAMLLALPALVSTAAAKETAWREYRSAHFLLRSNAPRKAAHGLLRDLEWYRFVTGRITGLDFSHDDTPPLRIWAWATFNGYLDATGAYGTGGFYDMGLDGAFALMTVEPATRPGQIDGRQIILHEYTHHLIHQFDPLQYPRWYDEGYAEFLSTMTFKEDGSFVIGAPLWRAAVLRDFDWVPFRELMESKGQYMSQHRVSMRDPRRARPAIQLQYAQGWITVHYLMTHPKRAQQLRTYLMLMNQPGVSDEEAFKRAFKTGYRELQKEVYQYFWSMKLPSVGSKFPDMPTVAVNERKLSKAEGAFQNVEALLVAGDYKDTGAKNWNNIVKLYEEGLRPKDMAYYLARIALASKRHKKDFETWLKAYQEHGGSAAVVASLKADYEIGEIFGEKIDFGKPVKVQADDRLHALRVSLKKGMLSDPDDPRPHFYYCLTYALSDDDTPDRQALASIGIVRDRLPDYTPGAIVEAILLAKTGERERALDQLALMQRWAFSRGMREQLGKVMKRIEEMPTTEEDQG